MLICILAEKDTDMTILRNLILVVLFNSCCLAATAATPLHNVDGPNSLNAVMVLVGLNKNYRYASNGEMQTMLKSPACRLLKNAEVRKNNDIGLVMAHGIYATKDIISHAFVQLSDKLVFEKHGSSKSEPYQIVDLQAVLAEYEFDQNPACRQNQFDRTACRIGTDFYRCDNLEQFITNNKSKIRMNTLSYFRQLEKTEQKLQDYLASESLTKNKSFEILRDLQVVAHKMVNFPESNVVEENFIFNIIANRFVSIAGQLNAMGYRELHNSVWQWENQDKNIAAVFEAILKLQIQDDIDLVYSKVRAKFVSVYAPIVEAERNVKLSLVLNTDESNLSAGVSLYKDRAHIEMGSDLHRNSAMTPDAYLAMLCHEVGHVLGGKPYSQNTLKPSAQWVSNTPSSSEGQSDYFSSLICMKKVFADNMPTDFTEFSVTPRIKDLCVSQYSKVLDQNICQRSVKSGFELMFFISSIYDQFGPNAVMPRADMNLTEGRGLSVGQLYPSLQCRFDTILAGALNMTRPDCWFVSE